jgi:transposase-like protein
VCHRGGERVIRRLETVQQATLRPLLRALSTPGTRGYTDADAIYQRLPEGGFAQRLVCPSQGEYAREDDGDGLHAIHVNTAEGFWSLLRSGLRPQRGLSPEKLPLYLGFFQFVHNARLRGKGLLRPLLELLLA